MGDTELTGLDALQARLSEIEGKDAESNDSVVNEPIVEEESDKKEEISSKSEIEEKEIESKPIANASKSEIKEEEENVYSPNYQYKFQDKMFEFDARVKSSIKSKEDEDYFRDLYTKSSAMDLMKTRSEEISKNLNEVKTNYSSLETKYKETDSMVNYFTKIMDGVNRGDANAFNQFLTLCDVSDQSLRNIGAAIVEHLENPLGYNNAKQKTQLQYRNEEVQRQRDSYSEQYESFARQKTEFEIKKAISSPEVQELVNYVDGIWGPGTFEKKVWAEGESLEAQNKTVSFDEIPNIVKSVADWFGKAKSSIPVNNTQNTPSQEAPKVITKQIVENPTPALPNLKGGSGIPKKSDYKDGSGVEGLRSRYKEITGSEW